MMRKIGEGKFILDQTSKHQNFVKIKKLVFTKFSPPISGINYLLVREQISCGAMA